jgi:hypothetical protein
MRRDGHDEDDEAVIPDGGSVRVPLMLCDHQPGATDGLCFHDGMGNPAGHKPGYVLGGNAEQQKRTAEAYHERTTQLQNAWRSPAEAAKRNETQLEAWRRPGASPGLRQDAAADRAAAYAGYVQRIQNAWRTP